MGATDDMGAVPPLCDTSARARVDRLGPRPPVVVVEARCGRFHAVMPNDEERRQGDDSGVPGWTDGPHQMMDAKDTRNDGTDDERRSAADLA